MRSNPDRQKQSRYRTDPDGHVHHQQAAADDTGYEQADRQSNQESTGLDHVRSPRAVRVILPTEKETLLSGGTTTGLANRLPVVVRPV